MNNFKWAAKREFDSLQAGFTANGLSLPIEVVHAAEQPDSLGKYVFAPTAMLAAVAAAGHMRRRNPARPPLRGVPPESKNDTFLGQVLTEILMANRKGSAAEGLLCFSYDKKIDAISVCDIADNRFGRVLSFLGPGNIPEHAQIITAGDTPLFLRKGSPGHASAMNVRPFVLNGAIVCPGTLLRVDTTYDLPLSVTPEERQIYGSEIPPDELVGNTVPWGLTTFDIQEVTQVSFGRLSTFALPPEQRVQEMLPQFDSIAGINPKAAELLMKASMDDIRGIVDAALPLAQPA